MVLELSNYRTEHPFETESLKRMFKSFKGVAIDSPPRIEMSRTQPGNMDGINVNEPELNQISISQNARILAFCETNIAKCDEPCHV